LRPFVAREGLSPHLDRARIYFDERVTGTERIREFVRLLRFYIPWYWRQWRRNSLSSRLEMKHPKVRSTLRYAERASRRLARAILYAMVMHREALRDDQGRQNRIEGVGEDLLTIAATVLSAESQERTAGRHEAWDLAEEFFRNARERINRNIRELLRNHDRILTAIGTRALRGDYPSLSSGIIRRGLNEYLPKDKR